MQFKQSELRNLIKEEVIRKKQIEDLQDKKTKLSEELNAVLKECGMGGNMEMKEHGDGIGLGLELNKENEEPQDAETAAFMKKNNEFSKSPEGQAQISQNNDMNSVLANLSKENFDMVYKNFKEAFPNKLVDFYNKCQKSSELAALAGNKLKTEPYKSDYINLFGKASLGILAMFLSDAIRERKLTEEKPSAGLSAKKRSSVVKAAKAGKDIGKKGKGFKDVEAKAKASGAKDPAAVAAATMWKNIPR